MQARSLGGDDLRGSCIGLGVMGTSEFCGAPDPLECVAGLERAVEPGAIFWDTAAGERYGAPGTSLSDT